MDYEETEARIIPQRIKEQLALIDHDKRVSFSWGMYKMCAGDSLDEAMKIADERLYLDKKSDT